MEDYNDVVLDFAVRLERALNAMPYMGGRWGSVNRTAAARARLDAAVFVVESMVGVLTEVAARETASDAERAEVARMFGGLRAFMDRVAS